MAKIIQEDITIRFSRMVRSNSEDEGVITEDAIQAVVAFINNLDEELTDVIVELDVEDE